MVSFWVLFADQKVPISRKSGVFAFDLEGVKKKFWKTQIKWGQTSGQTPIGGGRSKKSH